MQLGLLRRTVVFGFRRAIVRPGPASWAVLQSRRYGSQDFQPGGPPQPGQETPENSKDEPKNDGLDFKSTLLRMFESAATTFASIAVLG